VRNYRLYVSQAPMKMHVNSDQKSKPTLTLNGSRLKYLII